MFILFLFSNNVREYFFHFKTNLLNFSIIILSFLFRPQSNPCLTSNTESTGRSYCSSSTTIHSTSTCSSINTAKETDNVKKVPSKCGQTSTVPSDFCTGCPCANQPDVRSPWLASGICKSAIASQAGGSDDSGCGKKKRKKCVRLNADEDDDDEERKKKLKYPRSIFLIIATEFCERFSFCGLRSEYISKLFHPLLTKKRVSVFIFIVPSRFISQ